MKISVVIAAYNEEADIEPCLKSIKENGYRDFDIIVVDAGSTDRTVEIAEKYTDNILNVHTSCPGPARNMGVRESDAEVVAFTDADTIVSPNWLELFARDFSDPGVVAVGGVLRPKNPRFIDKIMFRINSNWWYRLTAVFELYQLGTPNCAYRRSVFLVEGGFNEELSMLEDTELSLRIKKHGKVVVDKDIWVLNSTRRFKQEGYWRVFFRYLKNYYTLFTEKRVKSKHFDTIEH